MERELMEKFIDRVKLESTFHKFLTKEIIEQMIKKFSDDYECKGNSKNEENPVELALQFYKYYNEQYLNIISDGIKHNKIIINRDTKKSFVDNQSGVASIGLSGNDGDIFVIVHELAHFIDRNSNPMIIPYQYNFISEVFAFYMEKQLALFLSDKKYEELIQVRKNNRMYFESKMMKSIEYQMYCEALYEKEGQLNVGDLIIDKVKNLMRYDYDSNIGLVNYLLRYPLANILSEYLVSANLMRNDYDICKICLDTDLHEILEDYYKLIIPKRKK